LSSKSYQTLTHSSFFSFALPYQVACQKYFIATHAGMAPDEVINHPNTYYDESRKHHNKVSGGGAAGGSGTPTPGVVGAAAADIKVTKVSMPMPGQTTPTKGTATLSMEEQLAADSVDARAPQPPQPPEE
jgi:hypothetical protein